MSESGFALALRDVRKSFGSIKAVDGLTLEVPPGICLGLLGPNGAGKSTTMRMLTGQALADSGTIEVLGYEIPRQSRDARARMGVVPQQDNLDVELTCAQILKVWARLTRVPGPQIAAAVDRALDLAQLQSRRDAKVNELSGGMRRRLLIARGLVHEPALVLLDEPTVGLDPQVRAEIWSLIDGLRSQGVTVIMSTHYIEEAERLADDVAVMSKGAVIARGTPADLMRTYAGELAHEVYGPPDKLHEIAELAAAHGLRSRRTGPSVSVLGYEAAPESLKQQLSDGVSRVANLEDVFVVLTGERLDS